MAHVGRMYKLQFRRDLYNGVNYVDGWPECYVLGLRNMGGSVGGVLQHIVVQAVNLLTDIQPPMFWISDADVYGGIPCFLILRIDDPYPTSASTITIAVVRQDTGQVLYKDVLLPVPRNQSPRSLSGGSGHPPVETPECHQLFGSGTMRADAAPWEIYNP